MEISRQYSSLIIFLNGTIILLTEAGLATLVVDGKKTDAEKRKDCFEVLSRLYIVSAETRQILYDNAVDFFVCRVLYHTLKVGAVEIGATEAVVGIAIEKLHIGTLFRKAL